MSTEYLPEFLVLTFVVWVIYGMVMVAWAAYSETDEAFTPKPRDAGDYLSAAILTAVALGVNIYFGYYSLVSPAS